MPLVRIPQTMRCYTGGLELVEAEGASVKHLVRALDQKYPGLEEALMAGDRLKRDVSVATDGQISQLGALQSLTGVKEVVFMPAISGG